MYHEHPLRILKYSVKNIWLLVFPFIRGIMTYHFSKDFLYTWIKGAWIAAFVTPFLNEYSITACLNRISCVILFMANR